MTDKELVEAMHKVLAAWDAEDQQELNDLSDEMWVAISDLRLALERSEQ